MKEKLSITETDIHCINYVFFQFNKSIFLKDVPHVMFGTPSLIFNFNNDNLIKSND